MNLDALLDGLGATTDWEERTAIYQEIPKGLHPEEALDLLDSLRRRTRDGNDLFFLWATADVLARDHPGVARTAEDLRQRFYDHVPQPPEHLFQWLETPHGRVEAWREVPPGRFLMGSPDGQGQEDERPRHEVEIEQAFRIGTGPVTNAQYAAFDPKHPVKVWEVPEEELAHHPVGKVTWYEANAFCDWFSRAFDFTRGARLAGEEEWEYACRAGTDTLYWSGSEEKHLNGIGWYCDNSSMRTHRIGENPANDWGLFDVHGNVREWTASPYRTDYSRRATHKLPPARVGAHDKTIGNLMLVLRGGGYSDLAPFTRSAIRCVRYPGVRYLNIGFRVVLPATSTSR